MGQTLQGGRGGGFRLTQGRKAMGGYRPGRLPSELLLLASATALRLSAT